MTQEVRNKLGPKSGHNILRRTRFLFTGNDIDNMPKKAGRKSCYWLLSTVKPMDLLLALNRPEVKLCRVKVFKNHFQLKLFEIKMFYMYMKKDFEANLLQRKLLSECDLTFNKYLR